MMICSPFDIVIVPFPFADTTATKVRPALVLSDTAFNRRGSTVLTMITSEFGWASDVQIVNLSGTGLSRVCTVRFKIFTLDNRLITKVAGKLAAPEIQAVQQTLSSILVL